MKPLDDIMLAYICMQINWSGIKINYSGYESILSDEEKNKGNLL